MGKGVLVLLCFSATSILSEAITLTRTSNACYSSGGDCGFHFLSCDHGLTISLRTMDYGFKEPGAYARKECDILLTNCVDYVNRTACCEYEVKTDCLKTYSWEHRAQIKERCEGKRGCTFHATYVSGGCENRPFIYDDVSAFSVIRYVCQNVTDSPATGSSTKQIITCDSCTTSPRETTRETSESENQHDESMLQLIVGVSVGLGSGIIFLTIIAVVCWVRMRSKPPATTSSLRSVRAGTITRRASRAPSANSHTVTSSMPSSVYSSFLYSDTLPSSHPDSIYSMPADVSSAGSMGRESHFRNYGFETVAEPEPPTSQSGEFGMSPEVPERPRSSEMASRPPPLSTDRRVVKNGVFSLFSLQLGGRRIGDGVTVDESRAQNGLSQRELPAYQPANPPRERHRSRGTNHVSSDRNELDGYEQKIRSGSNHGLSYLNLPQRNQPVMDLLTTVNALNRDRDFNASNSTPRRGEWRNLPAGEHRDWPSPSEPIYATPDKVRSRRVQAENGMHSQQIRQQQAGAGNSVPENHFTQVQTTGNHAVDQRNGPDSNSATRHGPRHVSISQQKNLKTINDDHSMGRNNAAYDNVDVIL